jgi:carbonic anhydrase
MKKLQNLLDSNRQWVEKITREDPHFFEKLAAQQAPEYLWIGCSDSRVPATQIVDLMPGNMFVHRNIANVVIHTDLNCLSVLQYAVEILKVKHIIICGHYGCGGVAAAIRNDQLGLIDNWLRNIKDIYQRHRKQFLALDSDAARVNLLCELNVIDQVSNVCHTTIVQNAWRRGDPIAVHGWIYDVHNGIVKDLDVSVTEVDQIPSIYRMRRRT